MSTEGEDERIARWERWAASDAAKHRRRMRWWRHMREYVSMKRLFVYRLVDGMQAASNDEFRRAYDSLTSESLADHPPWSHDRAGGSNWWPRYRWNRQG